MSAPISWLTRMHRSRTAAIRLWAVTVRIDASDDLLRAEAVQLLLAEAEAAPVDLRVVRAERGPRADDRPRCLGQRGHHADHRNLAEVGVRCPDDVAAGRVVRVPQDPGDVVHRPGDRAALLAPRED